MAPLLDTVVLVLRRGTLAALGAVGVILGGVLAVTVIFAIVSWLSPGLAANSLAAVVIVAVVALPFAGGATFEALRLALDGAPRIRDALRGAFRAGDVAPSLSVSVLPLIAFPATFFFLLGLLGGASRDSELVLKLVGLAALDLLSAWVWSCHVILPIAAAFVDRVDAGEADKRASAVFRGEPLKLLLLTNLPTLLVAVAVPAGPLQDRIAAVLTPDQLLLVRGAVTVVAVVGALLLHAAVAVAAYRTATSPSPS